MTLIPTLGMLCVAGFHTYFGMNFILHFLQCNIRNVTQCSSSSYTYSITYTYITQLYLHYAAVTQRKHGYVRQYTVPRINIHLRISTGTVPYLYAGVKS